VGVLAQHDGRQQRGAAQRERLCTFARVWVWVGGEQRIVGWGRGGVSHRANLLAPRQRAKC
jgi:hypothetical protein